MRQMFRDVITNLNQSMQNPGKRKTWQSSIGISIVALFVLSSIVVNNNVQAVLMGTGSYGYYGGAYGWQGAGDGHGARPSSDSVPATPASQAAAPGTGAVVVTWTAATTTGTGTALDNFVEYRVYYGASSAIVRGVNYAGVNSLSASVWTSSDDSTLTTQGAASSTRNTTITGLTNGTTYFFAVYAVDGTGNYGNAPSTAASTAPTATVASSGTSGGGGSAAASGGGGGAGAGTGSSFPTAGPSTVTATPVVVPVAATSGAAATSSPAAITTSVQSSASEFGVTLSTAQVSVTSSFVSSGTTTATVNLGSGERLALVRDQLETLGRVSVTALEQLATGQKPTERNLTKEQAQLPKVLAAFVKLTGHRPNFQNAKEDIAWNTMMYRIRFPRDLNKEKAGIVRFKAIYGRVPASPLDWAAVRAWGYALK